ncbi:unnamed protein product [Vitrella brassicaformis CCMP3155]|uniref:Uncharacterized protein n=2 Tax=Vitrella brassicaformis TaxID=1169539 RepID=A0A0G4EJ91_VITBC|nr:unnamed protein product [Vitrella brassicaformis CCMP3155]|eukprot:CEL96580.1 unnamed protein product [Vitrella brassicaformis CCMP3155]
MDKEEEPSAAEEAARYTDAAAEVAAGEVAREIPEEAPAKGETDAQPDVVPPADHDHPPEDQAMRHAEQPASQEAAAPPPPPKEPPEKAVGELPPSVVGELPPSVVPTDTVGGVVKRLKKSAPSFPLPCPVIYIIAAPPTHKLGVGEAPPLALDAAALDAIQRAAQRSDALTVVSGFPLSFANLAPTKNAPAVVLYPQAAYKRDGPANNTAHLQELSRTAFLSVCPVEADHWANSAEIDIKMQLTSTLSGQDKPRASRPRQVVAIATPTATVANLEELTRVRDRGWPLILLPPQLTSLQKPLVSCDEAKGDDRMVMRFPATDAQPREVAGWIRYFLVLAP